MYEQYTTEQLLADKQGLQVQYDANDQRIDEIEAEQVEILGTIAVIDTIIASAVTPTPTAFAVALAYPDVELTWDTVATTDWTLERATTSNFIDSAVIYVGTTASYTDNTGLVAGQTYYYRLTAVTTGQSNSLPATDSVAYFEQLASPVVIDLQQVSANVKGAFNLVTNGLYYDIYKNTINDYSTSTLLTTVVESPFEDVAPGAGTYWYWVVARNDFYADSAESAFGSIVVT